ncbi:hypothetical protein C8J57DRAFT_1729823 [Mycena rebaudengoi]|nr:hypothetical protein C8J57DRAFT_1729823 [Mycena rebaudengoi]
MAKYMRPDDRDRREPHSRALKIFCVLSAIMNFASLWLLTTTRFSVCNTVQDAPYLYSPAEHVVTYRIVKFSRGLADDIPIYERRPSPAVDEAWHELYSVAETRISKSEALKMPNRTWPLQREPGHYIFALDVFHQLHCLDVLRQQVHRGYNYTRIPISHVRHCIGAIRQALMCSADITEVDDGKPPPPPPDPNSVRLAEFSSLLTPVPATSPPSIAGRPSLGSTEPSVFLRPTGSIALSMNRVESPLAGISGSVLSTDFTPVTASLNRRATVEEVIDEDDQARLTGLGSQLTGSTKSKEPLLVYVHVSPDMGPARSPQVPPGGYESILGGRLAPSPYDLDGLLGPPSSAQSQIELTESERQRRRRDKGRASNLSSSDEEEQRLRDAVARSLEDPVNRESEGESRRPNVWDESARRLAAEAVRREREAAGQDDTERQQRDRRVDEDALVAEDLMIEELAEAEDRRYAEELSRLEQWTRMLLLYGKDCLLEGIPTMMMGAVRQTSSPDDRTTRSVRKKKKKKKAHGDSSDGRDTVRDNSTDSAFNDHRSQKREKRSAKKKEAKRLKREGESPAGDPPRLTRETRTVMSMPLVVFFVVVILIVDVSDVFYVGITGN